MKLPVVFLLFAMAVMSFLGTLNAENKERIPQVLVIGDSLYQGPAGKAGQALKGRVKIVSGNHQGYHSGLALEHFDELLLGKKWDLIHFNFGMNDLMHRDPATKSIRAMHRDVGGIMVSNPKEYEDNLNELVKKFKGTGAKLIWASTTPIVGDNGVLVAGTEVEYNTIASRVMEKHGVIINDMHTYGKSIHATIPKNHGKTYSYNGGSPLHTQMTRMILKELGIAKRVKGPLKAFVMIGGKVSVGHGVVKGWSKPNPEGTIGTLDDLVLNEKTKDKFSHLVDKEGNWATRSDVWMRFDGKFVVTGPHGTRYAGDRRQNKIGTEYSLGITLGNHFDEQVFIYKPAFGDPALVTDLASPSSGKIGRQYKRMLQKIRESLERLDLTYPEFQNDLGVELSGVILNIGERDQDIALYQECLPAFIKDLRKEFSNDTLPIVIVGSGRGGHEQTHAPELIKAQQAVSNLPEFKNNVVFTETRGFWPKAETSPNKIKEEWLGNAESFYQMGEAIGNDLLTLLK
jgi:hypothetical protein